MSVKKYCYCENNCKYETMSKEEILAAIAQAVATGKIGECDTGFITTIKTINNKALKFFVGEQSEYNALTEEQKSNLFAIITNDTTKEGIENAIRELSERADTLEAWKTSVMGGDTVVPKATHAMSATSVNVEKSTVTTDAKGNFSFDFEVGCFYLIEMQFNGYANYVYATPYVLGDFVYIDTSLSHTTMDGVGLVGIKSNWDIIGTGTFYHYIYKINYGTGSTSQVTRGATLTITKVKIAEV